MSMTITSSLKFLYILGDLAYCGPCPPPPQPPDSPSLEHVHCTAHNGSKGQVKVAYFRRTSPYAIWVREKKKQVPRNRCVIGPPPWKTTLNDDS